MTFNQSGYVAEIAGEYRKNLEVNRVGADGDVFDDYDSFAKIDADFDKEENGQE